MMLRRVAAPPDRPNRDAPKQFIVWSPHLALRADDTASPRPARSPPPPRPPGTIRDRRGGLGNRKLGHCGETTASGTRWKITLPDPSAFFTVSHPEIYRKRAPRALASAEPTVALRESVTLCKWQNSHLPRPSNAIVPIMGANKTQLSDFITVTNPVFPS